jgi:hypothetical protein
MPKIKISIEVDVKTAAIPRWLGLEGQDLLDAIRVAADSGDEVTCKVQPGARQVRFLPLSTPPMFRGFEKDGSIDDR